MRHVSAAGCLLTILLLAGCGQNGMFRDRGFDYLRAEPGKPLVYPEGLTPMPAQELYPVSGAGQQSLPVAAGDMAPVVDGAEKKKGKKKRKPKLEVPLPPQVVHLDDEAGTPEPSAGRVVSETRVNLTRDGNDYPVLMLDLDFNWAWQEVGDALRQAASVKVEDIDRGLGIYFLAINGKRNSAGEPWQLKLNYTANGIQVALQVDENAMAPADLSGPLMRQLKEEILKDDPHKGGGRQ